MDKKYSRNLGTGNGIELVQLIAPDAPIALVRTGWIATASNQGDAPANAIDGKLNTRWTTGTARAANQWFEVNMGGPQMFSEIILDANGSTDSIGGYQVFVSNDGVNWGAPIAQGTANDSKLAITLPTQTASYFKIVATDAGTHWWSIYELNAYTTSGQVTAPISGGSSTGGASSTGGNAATGSHANAGGSTGALAAGGKPSVGGAGTTEPTGTATTEGSGGSGTSANTMADTTVSSSGTSPTDKSGGCGCRLVPVRVDSPWLALLPLAGVLAAARRRRQRASRSVPEA